MKIDHYIERLLSDYNCVVVPGFGGFIGNYAPSRISPSGTTFYPPFKSVLFNVNLKQNDGLLANAFSSGEHVRYEEAVEMISAVVADWELRLLQEGKLLISNVGVISRGIDGNLLFEQDQENNYLSSSFGLSPVVSPAIHRERLQQKIEKKIAGYIGTQESKRRILPKQVKWAAVFAIPFGITTLLGIQNFDKIRDFSSAYSGWYSSALSPFKNSISPKPAPAYQKPVIHLSSIKVNHLSVLKPAPVITKPEVARLTEQPEHVNATVGAANQPFAIIVGAFRLRENALNLVNDLHGKGFNASIVDTTKSGLIRVSIQSFSDKNEAVQQLAVIRSRDFAGAWLLQK